MKYRCDIRPIIVWFIEILRDLVLQDIFQKESGVLFFGLGIPQGDDDALIEAEYHCEAIERECHQDGSLYGTAYGFDVGPNEPGKISGGDDSPHIQINGDTNERRE